MIGSNGPVRARHRASSRSGRVTAAARVTIAVASIVIGSACVAPLPDPTSRPALASPSPSVLASTAPPDGTAPPAASPPPASPRPIARLLDVTCAADRTVVAEPVVAARADGVHVVVFNPDVASLLVAFELPSGELQVDAGVERAETELVLTPPPGRYVLRCGAAGTPVEVVDPDGMYVRAELTCGGGSATAGVIDYAPGARGTLGNVLDVARRALTGLRPGDLIERAGYPAATGAAAVRVVRRGQVIAVLGYDRDAHGGWLLGGTQACSDAHVAAGTAR